MKRPTWQFHLLLVAILSLLSTAVNGSYIDGESIEKRAASPNPTTFKHHVTKHHYNHTKIHTVTVNNCTASAIQSKLLHQTKTINATKTSAASPTLPAIITMKNHTSTVFVCHKTKHVAGHHHSTKKHSSKHHTTTTHVSKKHHYSTKKHHSSKKHTSSKKEEKSHHVSKKKKHTTTKHHSTTTTHSKKHTTSKKTHNTKKTKTTTKAHKKHTTTAVATTTALEVVPASLPTARVNSSGDDSTDDTVDSSNEPNQDSTPESTTPEATTTPEPSTAAAAITPSDDSNNQVTAQSVNQEKSVDAEPQSKVVGVSVGAVVGCIAAAGLAGMFIYKRKQKNEQEQDIEYNDSNVNTRWKTQSFMAVVAGAVAKLPKRSNSQTSQRSVGVLGSIRRAVSNASSFRSNRSSQQSYGMATSDPLPPLARIDGDQARYYNEPTSPNEHTHAY